MHYKYIKEKTEINNRVAKIAESFQEMYELERIKEDLLKKQEEINEALKSVSARSIQLRQNINQLVDGIDEDICSNNLTKEVAKKEIVGIDFPDVKPVEEASKEVGKLAYVGKKGVGKLAYVGHTEVGGLEYIGDKEESSKEEVETRRPQRRSTSRRPQRPQRNRSNVYAEVDSLPDEIGENIGLLL